jgi:uncharacterized protein YeaO (DUF488 family)
MLGQLEIRAGLMLAALAVAPLSRADDLEERAGPKIRITVGAAEQDRASRAQAAEEVRRNVAERLKVVEAKLAKLQQWTQAQFQLAERGVIKKPEVMKPILTRWQQNREREVFQLLQHRDRVAGSIESGAALNTLLDQVAPAAYEHWLTRQVNPDHALPLYEPTALSKIDEDTLRHLIIVTNTLGAAASGHFNEDPINVHWPAALREERWTAQCQEIEKLRAQVLNDIKAGQGVSPQLDQELRDAVGQLNQDFTEFRRQWTRELRKADNQPAQTYRRICDAHRHIEQLISAVNFVVEASTRADLGPAEPFPGGTVEELLSYMHRNNLRFAAATNVTNRSAYHLVFDRIVRYYLDLNAVNQAQELVEKEIEDLQALDREAIDVILGKTLSADMEAALRLEELKFVQELLSDD